MKVHERRITSCLILIIVLLLPGCQSDGRLAPDTFPAGRQVGQTVVAAPALAAPDSQFNHLFTRYGGGWTGADGTYSVGLPDGRTVWMFGDTFLGRVNPDRSRAPDTPLINNSIAVQEDGTLSTRHGGTSGFPTALVAPADGGGWYWPADGTAEAGALRVFYRRFERTGPDPWQWAWVGTDLASLPLPGFSVESLVPVTSGLGVMYGSSILETPEYTYIYGTEDLAQQKYAHLARATAGQVTAQWEFYTAAGWSAEPKRSARVLEGVANQYSVVAFKNRYLLITMDNRTPFSNRLVGYLAHQPQGPWNGPVTIYSAPEAAGDVVAYNAFAHPQFTTNGRLLVSYNLNSVSDFSIPYADADTYRPMFIRVDLEQLMALFAKGWHRTQLRFFKPH